MTNARSAQPRRAGELRQASRALSWVFLLGFMLVVSAARGVYSSQGAEPSAPFELLVIAGWILFMWYWLKAQCEPYRPGFPLDLGYFLYYLWFILAPYYLWRSERWRGIAKFGVIVAFYAGSYLVSLVVHYALAG